MTHPTEWKADAGGTIVTRRGLLAGILAAAVAPAIARVAPVMPIRRIVCGTRTETHWYEFVGIDRAALDGDWTTLCWVRRRPGEPDEIGAIPMSVPRDDGWQFVVQEFHDGR